MSPAEPGGRLVTMSDISEMTGLSLPALSNKRRRDFAFPDPVAEGERGGLYSYEAVRAWMRGSGRGRGREVSRSSLAWNAASQLRGVLSADEISRALLEATALCGLDPAGSEDPIYIRIERVTRANQQLHGHFRGLERIEGISDRELGEVLHILDQLSPDEAVETFAEIIARSASWAGRGVAEHTTPESLASLMLELGPRHPRQVYDPAAGMGTLLNAAWVANPGTELELFGQEINPAAAELARLRFALEGAEAYIRVGDTLGDDQFPGRFADAVLCDPPFGMKVSDNFDQMDSRWRFGPVAQSSADIAWIQHSIAHISPEGRAVVTTPLGALFRSGRDKTTRDELVRRLAVEVVITLPPGILPSTSISLAAWVLRSPDSPAAPESVLLIDATSMGSRPSRSRTDLPQAAIERIVGIVNTWRSTSAITDAEVAVAVPIRNLLAPDATLVADRWLQTAQDDPESLQEAVAEAVQMVVQAGAALLDLPQMPHPTLRGLKAAQHDNLAALADAGRIELIRGTHIAEDDLAPNGIPIVGAADIEGPNDATRYVSTAENRPTTQPGDILIARIASNLRVAVETQYRVPSRNLITVRIVGHWIAPAAFAALLTHTEVGVSTMQGRMSIQPKSVELPRLTPNQYWELGTLFTALKAHATAAGQYQNAIGTLAEAIRQAVPVSTEITTEIPAHGTHR